MHDVWLTVAALAVINVALKAAGPMLAGGRELPPAFGRALSIALPALMAAIVVSGTFVAGDDLAVDERAAGVGAAMVAVAVRVPLLASLVLAAAVTATLRALA